MVSIIGKQGSSASWQHTEINVGRLSPISNFAAYVFFFYSFLFKILIEVLTYNITLVSVV